MTRAQMRRWRQLLESMPGAWCEVAYLVLSRVLGEAPADSTVSLDWYEPLARTLRVASISLRERKRMAERDLLKSKPKRRKHAA
jgi:hypothetical protein